MSLSPVTMDHGSNNPVATTGHGGPAIDIVAGVVDEDEGTCGILGGEIDVETLVSEQDIAEIFGADNVEVKEQI
ncbi:hypothetical protein BGX33_010898 [Mortierella sp. NVP41]|nr:hypothetical protein BGX33_010898 [Mortierella sp. NVP41]